MSKVIRLKDNNVKKMEELKSLLDQKFELATGEKAEGYFSFSDDHILKLALDHYIDYVKEKIEILSK